VTSSWFFIRQLSIYYLYKSNTPASLAMSIHSRTPLIRINWDDESSGYAENPDNWIFL